MARYLNRILVAGDMEAHAQFTELLDMARDGKVSAGRLKTLMSQYEAIALKRARTTRTMFLSLIDAQVFSAAETKYLDEHFDEIREYSRSTLRRSLKMGRLPPITTVMRYVKIMELPSRRLESLWVQGYTAQVLVGIHEEPSKAEMRTVDRFNWNKATRKQWETTVRRLKGVRSVVFVNSVWN